MLIVAAAITAWLLHSRLDHARFDWSEFAGSFLELDWKWVLVSAGFALLTYFGRAVRWAVMLKPLVPRPSVWRLFKATAIGFTAVVLLGRPGEFVRPCLISLKERVPLSSQVAAWFLERIWDLLAVLLAFGFALTQVRTSRASLGPSFQWVLTAGGYALAVIGAACLIVLVALSQFSDTMRKRLVDALRFLPAAAHARADRIITAFLEGTAAVKTPQSILLLFVYTALEWVLITLCLIAAFQAYPETSVLGLRDVLIFMGFIAFGSVVQIPGIGGGLQIVSIVVLTQIFGFSLELATSFALMIWILTFVVIVPPGLFLAFHEGFNWKRLRELEKEAADRVRHSPAPEISAEESK